MLQLCKELRASDPTRKIDVYLGFREESYLEQAFEQYADSVTLNIGGYVVSDVDFSLDATYYACGPTPMLRAAAQTAEQANASLLVSLEKHMACGVGACLGCTCQTANGRKRVCKDGPVFDYREVRDAI
jgi:dihydroorotate dehydrogenase electron transfer subunit